MRMQAVRLGRLRMMPCRTRCNGAGTRATLGTRQQTLRESTCTCCWSRSACCNHRDAGRAHQQHQRRGVCMRGSMWIAPQSALPNDYHTCTIGSTNVRGGQRSTVCAASKGGGQKRKGSLLAGVPEEFRFDLVRIIELAELHAARGRPHVTGFYAAPVVEYAQQILKQFPDIKVVAWGGFWSAERCRLLVGPADPRTRKTDDSDADSDAETEQPAIPPELKEAVVAVVIEGNFMFNKAEHMDFMGSIMNTGILRPDFGDIQVTGDRGAHVMVNPERVHILSENLTRVRQSEVTTRQISTDELNIAPPRVEERSIIERSVRLDAVAAGAFNTGRAKMSAHIQKHELKLNSLPKKATTQCKTGDQMTLSGKGKVVITDISPTSTGKFRISIKRNMLRRDK